MRWALARTQRKRFLLSYKLENEMNACFILNKHRKVFFNCIKLVYNLLPIFGMILTLSLVTWTLPPLEDARTLEDFLSTVHVIKDAHFFLPRNISNRFFKTMQCIYWDFLILTQCVWPLPPKNVAASARKRKTHFGYYFTDLWRTFDV